jgi:hypothetical protein
MLAQRGRKSRDEGCGQWWEGSRADVRDFGVLLYALAEGSIVNLKDLFEKAFGRRQQRYLPVG